jgi:uroporphyrinogen-III synthase
VKPRHLILTRPRQDAGAWVEGLRAAGHRVSLLPLIETRPLAWADGPVGHGSRASAIMFVSAAAVRAFLALPGARVALCSDLVQGLARVWVTGPGTARVLLDQGVAASGIDQPLPADGRFDSEALWAVVRTQVRPGFVLHIVRGRDAADGDTGRPWLAERAREAGARIEEHVVYQREAPDWDAAMRGFATQAATDGSIWLFSSARALGNLHGLMPATHWGRAFALATHPRVAQAARDAGFGSVLTSGATLDQVLASIESNDEFGYPHAGP